MKSDIQKQDGSSKEAIKLGAINNLKTEVSQQHKHAIERMCGTHLMRSGLETMTEKDRNKLFKEMQITGLLPII